MLFAVIKDAAIAVFAAFLIIYLLAFSLNCIFFSVEKEKFSFNGFIQQIRNINREEQQ